MSTIYEFIKFLVYIFLGPRGGSHIKVMGRLLVILTRTLKGTRSWVYGSSTDSFSPLSGLKSLTLTPYFNKEIKNMPECILGLKKHTGIIKNTRKVLEKNKQH